MARLLAVRYNICTNSDGVAAFFSDITGNGYFPNVLGADPKVTPAVLMNDIITNEWSTLEALFDGAFNCTIAGGYGQPPNFVTNNNVDLSCVSQLLICSCASPCLVALINGNCPITTCGVC